MYSERTVLDLSSEEAKRYFLRESNFCNIRLPAYFTFQTLLNSLNESDLIPKQIEDEGQNSKTFTHCMCYNEPEENNCQLFTNKTGHLSWRKLQIINPVAYIYLVNIITSPDNWSHILGRFAYFQSNEKIICCSMPLINRTTSKTIKDWHDNFEKTSIKQALEFNYMLTTDISDCYGSIYTHSIAWAIHKDGRDGAKKERCNKSQIWNAVDTIIQNISNQQTNGIPQGSILMDFIAEIVLGYADALLSEKIESDTEIDDYRIYRYRDDYRIFTKTKLVAEKIGRYLSEVLGQLNLNLNEEKTIISDDIITDSQKNDKIYKRDIAESDNLENRILQIYSLSRKFPNSGSIERLFSEFYDRMESSSLVNHDIELIMGIAVNTAYRNPRTYPYAIAIAGRAISLLSSEEVNSILKIIKEKFSAAPNVELFEVWLQRLFIKDAEKRELFEEANGSKLCKYVSSFVKEPSSTGISTIWSCDCFDESIQEIFASSSIIDLDYIHNMRDYPESNEIKTFSQYEI